MKSNSWKARFAVGKWGPWTLWANDLCQGGTAAVSWVNSIPMDICLHGENIWEGRLWDFCVRHEAYSENLPSYSSAHVSCVSHLCHFYAEKTRNSVMPKLRCICCSVSMCFISLSKAFKTECSYMCVYICIHWLFSFYINSTLLENWKTEWINVWNKQFESEIICGWRVFEEHSAIFPSETTCLRGSVSV